MEITTQFDVGETVQTIFPKVVFKDCPNCGGNQESEDGNWTCSVCKDGQIEEGVRWILGRDFKIMRIKIDIVGLTPRIFYWDTDDMSGLSHKDLNKHMFPADRCFASKWKAEMVIETLNREIDNAT